MNTKQNPINGADGEIDMDATQPPLLLVIRDIKLAHSVFALPFAMLAAFLATPATGGELGDGAWKLFAFQFVLVVFCMVCARTWAMLINRLVDAVFDADNPRTAGRAIASGELSSRTGWRYALASAVGFVLLCSGFWLLDNNFWPLVLSVPTLGWIALYSYTKRFTALSHLFLGAALGISPLAAAIAVEPGALSAAPALWWLAGMVMMWVAGFDVLYALQDEAFDREAGLFSLPAKFGGRRAVLMSRAMHLLSVAMLILAWRSDPRLGVIFGVSVGLVGVLLVVEHLVLIRRGLAGLPVVFFTINGVVSCVLGTAGIVDLLQG